MYAIIESGSKQYRVEQGDEIDVELLHEEDGAKVSFESVLMLNDGTKIQIGAPTVSGCTVMGEVLGEVKGPKVISYKYKRRKNCRRKKGHRQRYARVKITEISAGGTA